jgi:hypothetical protein
VEQLGAGSGTERVEPLTQDSFELLELHQANASTREEQRPAPADGRSGRYSSLLRLRAGDEILLLVPRRRSRSRPRPVRPAVPGAFSPLIETLGS